MSNNEVFEISELYTEIVYDYIGDDRNMRNKTSYLIRNILSINPEELKKHDGKTTKSYFFKIEDRPVIKELLIRSVSTSPEDAEFVDWFNGSIKPDDYRKILSLYNKFNRLINDSYDNDVINIHTASKWDRIIKNSLNVVAAQIIVPIIDGIEGLCRNASVIDHSIGIFNNIKYIESSLNYNYMTSCYLNPSKQTLNDMLDGCHTLNDFRKFIAMFSKYMNQQVYRRSEELIEIFTNIKKRNNLNNIIELFDEENVSSEIICWADNVYTYLIENKEIANRIEEKVGATNLPNFFKIPDTFSKQKMLQNNKKKIEKIKKTNISNPLSSVSNKKT